MFSRHLCSLVPIKVHISIDSQGADSSLSRFFEAEVPKLPFSLSMKIGVAIPGIKVYKNILLFPSF